MTEPTESSAAQQLLADQGNVNLIELLTQLLRAKRFIVLTGLVFGLCGLALAFLLRPEFTATTEILPPQQQRGSTASAMLGQIAMGGDAGALAGVGSAIQSKSAADMYAVMIGARPVEDALIQQYRLQSIYRRGTMSETRTALAAHTAITPSKEGFITIAVTDHDRQLAVSLANGYVVELRNLMRGLALSEASQRRVFYEGQLAKSKEDLANAEVAFKQMQQSNRMISLDTQAKTLIEGAAGLRAQIASKEVELQGLRAYSTEANPQVQIEEKELSALRSQLGQTDVRNEGGYSGAGLSSVPAAELSFVRASRELKYQEGLYDLLVRQYEGSRIDEARDAPVVQVVEPAIPPDKKSGPRRTLIVLGAFLLGIFLGIAYVLLRSWRSGLSATQAAKLAELRNAAFR